MINITKDVPARTAVAHSTEIITINFTEKIAYVYIRPEGGDPKNIAVDVMQLFEDYSVSTTNRNVIRLFFKYLIAKAMEVESSVITDPILEP